MDLSGYEALILFLLILTMPGACYIVRQIRKYYPIIMSNIRAFDPTGEYFVLFILSILYICLLIGLAVFSR